MFGNIREDGQRSVLAIRFTSDILVLFIFLAVRFLKCYNLCKFFIQCTGACIAVEASCPLRGDVLMGLVLSLL